jgi:broad specificity phosphatase PhoE
MYQTDYHDPDHRPEGGETRREARERILACLAAETEKGYGKTLLAVVSGQVAATLLRETLHFDGVRRYKPLPLSLNVFSRDRFTPDSEPVWVLHTWGDVAHSDGITPVLEVDGRTGGGR